MSKIIELNQNPQNMGGPSYHPMMDSIGRVESTANTPKMNKGLNRTYNSFKSLAEILGTPNDNDSDLPAA